MSKKLTEQRIHSICEEFAIKNYKINDDMSIDVDGDVNISNRGLTRLPLQFNYVNGDFDCSSNNLTNLNKINIECYKFDCSHNNITTLKGSIIRAAEFYFNNNKIKSFEGCELSDENNRPYFFDCSHNKIKSLEGFPFDDVPDFNCSYNRLTSLNGCPTSGEYLDTRNNNLRSLDDLSYLYYDNILIFNCGYTDNDVSDWLEYNGYIDEDTLDDLYEIKHSNTYKHIIHTQFSGSFTIKNYDNEFRFKTIEV